MNVGIIQFKATKGDVPSSRARLAALTEEAAKTSDIVVLPEMAATGYSFETRDEVMAVAEPSDGPTAELFRDIAKRTRNNNATTKRCCKTLTQSPGAKMYHKSIAKQLSLDYEKL